LDVTSATNIFLDILGTTEDSMLLGHCNGVVVNCSLSMFDDIK